MDAVLCEIERSLCPCFSSKSENIQIYTTFAFSLGLQSAIHLDRTITELQQEELWPIFKTKKSLEVYEVEVRLSREIVNFILVQK